MSSFGRKLSNELMRRLPQSNEYEWSRQIEGALVRSEEPMAHRHVVIIIDCEIDETTAAPLVNEIIRFVKHNQYFRKSKYRVFVWKQGKFALVSPLNTLVNRLEQHLSQIKDYDNVSGSWENFVDIYTPHKKAGQAMLITTANKVTSLKNTHAVRTKNLLILYPAGVGTKNIRRVAGIPCIAYDAGNMKGE